MAETQNETSPQSGAEVKLEGGTYEIIRNRLTTQGNELRGRLDKLNVARKEVFGSIDTELLGTDRLTTQHNCTPRDMVAIDDRFVFAYNIVFGLKTETNVEDVFAVYKFEDGKFSPCDLNLVGDDRFQRDFKEIYRFYKGAVFAKFFTAGPHLYMNFRIGKSVGDIKTFKWIVREDAIEYVDNRSDHEVRFPPQHDFEWVRTTRDQFVFGEHPHISIEDRVFVETVGGDLTVKVEDNTESGEGLYAELVDDEDQTLDDAEIYYAILGNIILMKIRPYQEKQFRHLVFNEKLQTCMRLDSIEDACVLLPDDHGLIFSNGYYLQTGEYKTFENEADGMIFERRIASPNGEDYLYVFFNRLAGVYVLLQYNLIEQKVKTPVVCNGYTLFDGGELVCFRAGDEPQKHHVVQVWQTPYVSDDFTPDTHTDSYLYKVGNKDIVRAMAECTEILGLIDKENPYASLYLDLVKTAGATMDAYFWMDREETFNLKETLGEIRDTAAGAVEEFEKVTRVKKNTAEQTKKADKRAKEAIADVGRKRFDHINEFVTSLAELRAVRGEIISLRDLRYVDATLVEKLDKTVSEEADRLAERSVAFLLREDSLAPYQAAVQEQHDRIPGLEKAADAKKLEEEISQSASELEMLIEIVSNLKIDDATQRTTIIDNISTIFSGVNTARAALKRRIKELLSVEGVAEFNSQMKLLNQGVVNYLDVCDSPEKCEEFLTKVMIQVEELEGRFSEFDEFVVQLAEKRDEIYNAFESRKLQLVEARNRRAGALMKSADRILTGIKARVEAMESVNDINAYFASDLMIEKVRGIVDDLTELDDTVKVDDIQSRLKTIKEDAVRQLKDRQDLFVGGENVIKLGENNFSVNVQALDLTTVMRDDEICLHLTGTRFFEAIQDERLEATRAVWQQEVVSENREVYRAEYLAYLIYREVEQGNLPADEFLAAEPPKRTAMVQKFMGPRYAEGYAKGVHDHDATLVLAALLDMRKGIGLLRFDPTARAMGRVFWNRFADRNHKSLMSAKLSGVGLIHGLFPGSDVRRRYVTELATMLAEFSEKTGLFGADLVDEAAEYLFCELISGRGFAISRTAADLFEAFQTTVMQKGAAEKSTASLTSLSKEPAAQFALARDWLLGMLSERGDDQADVADFVDETAALLLQGKVDATLIVDGSVRCDLEGLAGSHALTEGGRYRLDYNRFMRRLSKFAEQVVPTFTQYTQLKRDLVDEAREEIRLDEFRPRVLTSFVRNRLIDSVYLPLIGNNLAKQVGVVGEQKRTDLMGLLLLVSPPGYGKTTLMEYVANRLGVIFMKINGPAIGHMVTSLDPTEATNAAAREEVDKLNLALEMGDNVMIYVDDIQHCNPEFLQKFISLCDAQRKMEGVYKGKTRTYDLRGRKVVVVMAGNPYTESGQKFKIPDMLSNRADVYNLGEIIGDSADAFEMSYLENCLTSNPALNQLATRSQKDVYSVIRLAERGEQEGIELEGSYSAVELNEFVAVMKKLLRVRDMVLAVNREYIHSAAMADEYRIEPPFKLQGSYRNMNRIAEKVVPIMNDAELETLILSNYENDSQTLTSDAEANMLKFKELMGILSDEEAKRWKSIQRTYQENVRMRGIDQDDAVGQVVMQMRSFSDGLESIREAVVDSVGDVLEQKQDTTLHDRINTLVTELNELETGVKGINTTLSQGLSQMHEDSQAATEAMASASGGDQSIGFTPEAVGEIVESLRNLGHALAESSTPSAAFSPEVVQEIVESIRNLTPAPAPEPEARPAVPAVGEPGSAVQEVHVMHQVPRNILNVLRSQFQLMQGWLEPLAAASMAQRSDIKKLRTTLEATLQHYGVLLQDLEGAGGSKKKKLATDQAIRQWGPKGAKESHDGM
jgi:DNA repair ATPase/ATPase family protein associated with various cellular activities (AAA)